MRRLLLFSLVGFAAQLVDGSLGMAYGVTASSLLAALGTSAALTSASVHLAEVGTSLVSGGAHWGAGNISWRTVRWIGVPGAAGAYLGATILTSVDGRAARPWIAVLLIGLGFVVLVRFAFGRARRALPPERLRRGFLMPLGVVGGFVDAIGGGGWGPITTPALMTIGRVEPRTAVGSVSASEFLVSLAASIGFLTHLRQEAIDLRVVAGLLAGGVVVAPVAAFATRRLPMATLGTLIGGLLVITNAVTLLRLAHAPAVVIASMCIAGAVASVVLARRATVRQCTPVLIESNDEGSAGHRGGDGDRTIGLDRVGG